MPIRQFLYFDSLESLPDGVLSAEELQPTGGRYDAQIAVFGRTLQAKLGNSRYFIVGLRHLASFIHDATRLARGRLAASISSTLR